MITLKDATPLAPNFTLPNTRVLFVVVNPAMPVPVRDTCCGLVAALSLKVSDALCAPTALGANVTPIVQLVLGATVMGIAPQVPVPLRLYSGSDGIALAIASEFVAPVFAIVTVFVDAWPTAVLANASEAVTDTVVIGVAVAVAVAVAVEVEVAVAVEVGVAVAV